MTRRMGLKSVALYKQWISAARMKLDGLELPLDERILSANLHDTGNWELTIIKEWTHE